MTERTTIAVIAVVAAAVLIGSIVVARRAPPTVVAGDLAVTESYTRHAADARLLVGPYSRFQWHHPGPAFFYILAPFYVASGGKAAGLMSGALAINIAALVAVFVVAVRTGRGSFAICAGLAALVLVYRGRELLASPWNPHALVLPLMALIVVGAAAVAFNAWLLPAAAFIASFLAQTHVGIVPAAAALLVAAAAGAWHFKRQPKALLLTVAVLLAMWAVPLTEQVRHAPGNLSQLFTFFVRDRHAGQPFGAALHQWADTFVGVLRPEFAVPYGGTFRASRSTRTETYAVAELAAVAVVFFLAARRGARFHAALSAGVLLAALVALWSATEIRETPMDHDLFWLCGAGALGMALIAAAVIDAISPRLSTSGAMRCVLVASFTICAGFGIARLLHVARQSNVPPDDVAAIRKTANASLAYLQQNRVTRPLVVIDQEVWPYAVAVLLEFEKHKQPYSVETDWLPMFTGDAALSGREDGRIVVGGARRHLAERAQAGNTDVAEAPPIFIDAAASR